MRLIRKSKKEKNFDVLIIHIDWIFEVLPLSVWLSYNRMRKNTEIIAFTTDFSLDHAEWCENNNVLYVMLPLTHSVFKVLIESNT